MKHILHILPQFHPGGGMERMVMNYFDYIDHSEYSFDVLTHSMNNDYYSSKIEENHGNVFVLPHFGFTTYRQIERRFDALLSDRRYDVIHCHMANAAFLYLKIAKKHDIPIRILHSHQDRYADTVSHSLRNVPLVALGRKYANVNLACSCAAGDFLFGKGNYRVLRNAIPIEHYQYDAQARRTWRNQQGVTAETPVFIYVGRLTPQKNPKFALEVFSFLLQRYPTARLYIAGSGELESDLRHQADSMRISPNVHWLGNVSDVSKLYQGADAMLFPSKYEGLGIAAVESQTAGLATYLSEFVPEEAVVSNFAHSIPISLGADTWASRIAEGIETINSTPRTSGAEQVRTAGFDIKENTGILEEIYSGHSKL
ncbi:glycosyltransferase [Bifidobacterium thermophilum]|uniref:Glycosyltransferase n=1 Tax=Bifidobacterium thermophilum RBL67 TaxID=1254439 RepID=M4RB10_9BIFI|nr:glycosyltransferase [Bifidobacterium thermophilum]AGH40620.1 glycosyltransferase [Bifidobacterium thermophilum RBL67]MDW8486447.1 glycosyltransferase [Bifidobacterium thermophilum]